MNKFRIFFSLITVIIPSSLQNAEDQDIQNNKLCSGFKTSSLTLRKEHKLQVSDHKVLWKIFGLKKGEVSNLEYYIQKLQDFYVACYY
jgi:hypothetical protein